MRSMLALAGIVLSFASQVAFAQREIVPGPDPGSRRFGSAITLLPNGNYLVSDPAWAAAAGTERAGAVYLYSGDGTLLSRLNGSATDDAVGSGGIVVLANGNFVVHSPDWRAAGGILQAGAVTWGDAATGFGAVGVAVDAANSLVGASAGDRVGAEPVVPLANGSYVVASGGWDRIGVAIDAGAVTWSAADGSTVGEISAANSLVGSQFQDRVGARTLSNTPGVVALGSGHFVVASTFWDHGAIADVGAVTWARDDGSITGPVSAGNSLIGTQAADRVGTEVIALANGHYIVQSWSWDNGATADVGAVTWCDGGAPRVGTVTPANSLIGSQLNDRVGVGALALANGHYVVASFLWNNGPVQFAGAVTWRDGSGPQPGVVSVANSLVGSRFADSIGFFPSIGIPPLGVVALPGGDYVVASPEWNLSDSLTRVGAATWGDGEGGTVGPVGVDNSLIGASFGDAIAQYIVVLGNGDYVVGSPFWTQRRGAATWGSGQAPLTGVLGAANSLVGERSVDFVSSSGIYRLADGGYAVPTPRWGSGTTILRGAVSRAAPGSGVSGPVSAENSFIGELRDDLAGAGGLDGLPDGSMLVRSTLASGVGALTRIPAGATPADFTIRAAGSLIGRPEDRIGGPGPTVMPDGAIVSFTASAAVNNAGAITLFRPDDPFRGTLPELDTVRSAVADGGPLLTHRYLVASGTLLVGDPAGNRLVRLRLSRIFHDGFD
jgi:hypothetical protein